MPRSTTPFFHPQLRTATPGASAGRAWSAYMQLDQSQWLDRATIEAWQMQKLRQIVQHCTDHVPHYRRTFGQANVQPDDLQTFDDLERLPIIDRREYLANAEHLTATELPEGLEVTGTVSTSGTTGIPVVIQQTDIVRQKWLAFAMRDMEWCRFDPRQRLATIRPSGKSGDELSKLQKGVNFANWGPGLAAVVETGMSHFMDLTADPSAQMKWLAKIDPDYLLSYPSNLEMLARLAQSQGVRLANLRGIQAIGETLDADVREITQEAFGVPIFDTYSCCEGGYLASACPDGHGYHVHSENVIVEVLDDDNQPCHDGEQGRIVLSTLHNHASPFVRYDIHDDATVSRAPCECGRGGLLLKEIHGKRRPAFLLRDGTRKSSAHAVQVIRRIAGFYQFQIVQETIERVEVRIVPDTTWDNMHYQSLMKAMTDFFDRKTDIEIHVVESIPQPQRGKSQSTRVAPELTEEPAPKTVRE